MEATALRYGWCWIDGEDDNAGDSWIQIGPFEGDRTLVEETATIMCRDYANVQVEHPEWIIQKEAAAQMIVDALNAGAPADTEPQIIDHDAEAHDWETCAECLAQAVEDGVLADARGPVKS